MTAQFASRAHEHRDRTALRHGNDTATYAALLEASAGVAGSLLGAAHSLNGQRIAYVIPPSIEHVAVQWGIWRAGGIAVPLALAHPPAEWAHIIQDSAAARAIGTETALADLERAVGTTGCTVGPVPPTTHTTLPHPVTPDSSDPALIVYTSGTTGKPKGVVLTHGNLDAQVATLHAAWKWTADDRILLVLPLHHVHGIVNVVCSALWAGAQCEMESAFDARRSWARLASGDLTVFMAVPTVYRRLIEAWNAADAATQHRWSEGIRSLRLMVSGSAALPVSVLHQWRDITGHTLLERYGMTETGMVLGNPLHGDRRPGTVGHPLPGVEVRLESDHPRTGHDDPAELLVRGAGVFGSYWRRPQETASSFKDGWFVTGDLVRVDDGYYRIVGRRSVDIIKTGGYKVSALEIEEVCRSHPGITDCAVVGVEDDEWGERVCIAVEHTSSGSSITLESVQRTARAHLAPYKTPRDLRVVAALPRNAMGKVVKSEVRRLFDS